jgi:hypothetical protein
MPHLLLWVGGLYSENYSWLLLTYLLSLPLSLKLVAFILSAIVSLGDFGMY